ncbi:MAG: hypothetical protein QGH37_33195 [Candidatus Poribacteria bacterium]|nr:hypothetical protein [Candidatus Poribacteria bacterium]
MSKSNTLTQRLSSPVNKKIATPPARELGLVQRQPKIDLTPLVWAIIFASSGGPPRTIAMIAQESQLSQG